MIGNAIEHELGPLPLDHLVWGGPNLQAEVQRLERLTGVQARLGGQHQGEGTCNAVLRLGPAMYLELIASGAYRGKACAGRHARDAPGPSSSGSRSRIHETVPAQPDLMNGRASEGGTRLGRAGSHEP